MKMDILCFLSRVCILCSLPLSLAQAYYGKELCQYPEFKCIKVKKTDTWEKLWPNPNQRDLVMRLNRTNLPLNSRTWILTPRNISDLDLLDLSPFPEQKNTSGKKLIYVDLGKLAFGAYNESGKLLHWGPISGGKEFCPDIQKSCTTPSGIYNITVKRGEDCFSKTFPVDTEGGAPMPYCMFFHQGYALHGSNAVPGYHASHGCIRIYSDDARWLNEEFAQTGTQVVVVDSGSRSSSKGS